MRNKSFSFLALLIAAALLLSACSARSVAVWPGLSTDGNTGYLAEAQFVRKLDAASGRQDWSFPAAANNNIGGFVSDPSISADMVVVGSEGATGTYSGILYGLDPAKGEQKWCLAFDQKGAAKVNCPIAKGPQAKGLFGLAAAVDHRIIGGLALADGVVYFGLASGTVYAVEASTGKDLWWSDKPQRDVWAAPAVDAQTIYVPSLDHRLYALDRATGALRWQQDLGAALAGTPTLDNGTLYVGTFGSVLYALDAATGAIRWSKPAHNWIWSGPALVDGILYFVDVGGTVFAWKVEDGTEVWQKQPGGAMRARPVVTADTVYIGDRNGTLFALNRADGSTRWSQTMKGQLLVTPLTVGDLVVVAPYGGQNLLEAYSAAGGEFKWAYAPGK